MKEQYFTGENIGEMTEDILLDVKNAVPRVKERELDMGKSALLVLDAQKFFLEPASHAYIPSSQAIIPNINLLITFFLENNRPVYYTRHYNNEENSANMGKWWGDLLLKDGPLFDVDDKIRVEKGKILDKSQYDAFHGTDLWQLLSQNLAEHVVICGVMTNLCCETTARSAFVKGLEVWMPVDATATYNRQLHIASFMGLSFGFLPLTRTRDIISA